MALRMARWVSTRPGCCARNTSSSNSFGVSRILSSPRVTAVTIAIDDEIAADDRAGTRRRRFDAPQRHADARQQLLGAERLRHVVVGARVERADLVGLGTPRRQHDDRRRTAVSQQPAHLDTVHVRQSQIEDDQIRIDTFHALRGRLCRTSPWTRRSRAIASSGAIVARIDGSSSTISTRDGMVRRRARQDAHG